MTLTEFLLARIAEDEAEVDSVPDWFCTDSARGDGWGSRGDCPLCDAYMFDGTEDATEQAAWEHLETAHRRARVLAECEAKREALGLLGVDQEDPGNALRREWATGILRRFAAIHADHPEYDESWRL